MFAGRRPIGLREVESGAPDLKLTTSRRSSSQQVLPRLDERKAPFVCLLAAFVEIDPDGDRPESREPWQPHDNVCFRLEKPPTSALVCEGQSSPSRGSPNYASPRRSCPSPKRRLLFLDALCPCDVLVEQSEEEPGED